jgi:hypothetical protein
MIYPDPNIGFTFSYLMTLFFEILESSIGSVLLDTPIDSIDFSKINACVSSAVRDLVWSFHGFDFNVTSSFEFVMPHLHLSPCDSSCGSSSSSFSCDHEKVTLRKFIRYTLKPRFCFEFFLENPKYSKFEREFSEINVVRPSFTEKEIDDFNRLCWEHYMFQFLPGPMVRTCFWARTSKYVADLLFMVKENRRLPFQASNTPGLIALTAAAKATAEARVKAKQEATFFDLSPTPPALVLTGIGRHSPFYHCYVNLYASMVDEPILNELAAQPYIAELIELSASVITPSRPVAAIPIMSTLADPDANLAAEPDAAAVNAAAVEVAAVPPVAPAVAAARQAVQAANLAKRRADNEAANKRQAELIQQSSQRDKALSRKAAKNGLAGALISPFPGSPPRGHR